MNRIPNAAQRGLNKPWVPRRVVSGPPRINDQS